MNKRVVSALLWFYAGWTFGSLVAVALGLGSILGLIIGTIAAILVAAAPRQMVRMQGGSARTTSETQSDSI